MAASLSHTIRAVLATLEQRACEARNRADHGDPRLLRGLLTSTARDEDARYLLDDGALRELCAEDPATGQLWQDWLRCDLPAEAAWRSQNHQTQVEFGPLQVNLHQLSAELGGADPDRRAEAWRVGSHVFEAQTHAARRWLQSAPSTDAEPEPTSNETRSAGGLIIPDANMIAVFSQSAIVVPPDPGHATTSAAPESSCVWSDADALRISELAMELADANKADISGFGDWVAAIQGHEADYRPQDLELPTHRALPWPRFGVPLQRGSFGAFFVTPTARRNLAAELGLRGAAFAAGGIDPVVTRKRLSGSKAAALRRARGLGLAWCGLLLSSMWVDLAAGDEDLLRSFSKSVTAEGAPSWWCLAALAEADVSKRPGESRALYAYSGRLASVLCAGVTAHAALRDRFDCDWILNDDTWDVAGRVLQDAKPANIEDVVWWLRSTCQV